MTEKRENGNYWLKGFGIEVIGYWLNDHFQLHNTKEKYYDDDFAEINENRIQTPDEQKEIIKQKNIPEWLTLKDLDIACERYRYSKVDGVKYLFEIAKRHLPLGGLLKLSKDIIENNL